MMLLKQDLIIVSDYWEQTEPTVTRKREAACVKETTGEAKRVSTLLG